MNKMRIYLDHNATTPMRPEVLEAMLPFFKEKSGNASSVHSFGRETRYAVEVAREKIADFIGAASEEIVFTSGGTESNNLAIFGTAEANASGGNHIITSRIEHSAVLRVCQKLEKKGYSITYLPVDGEGNIQPENVKEAITDKTVLISIMHANNEVGTIEPIAEIGAIAKEKDVLFHSDTVQSFGKIPVNVHDLNLDLLSVSGHKIAGPKGIGFLYKRKDISLEPQIVGGSHERNLRAGTENVALIVGLGKAVELLGENNHEKNQKIAGLRDAFEKELTAKIKNISIMGNLKNRLPNTSGICFHGLDGGSIMRNLDLEGIAVSTGSACMSGAVQKSHVLEAMGVPDEVAMGAIRFSFGEGNSRSDITKTIKVLQEVTEKLKTTKKE